MLHKKNRYFKKLTGTLTALIFLWQTAVIAAPQPIIETLNPSGQETRLPSTIWEIEIPESLGTVKARFEGSSSSAMVLIQDAHAHFEAQKKIQGILQHLHSSYGMNLLLLEGGFSRLNPDWYRYFESAELNLELAENLARKGVADGPELFLLQASLNADNTVQAFGVEEPRLYKNNLKSFREVHLQKAAADEFLNALKSGILTRSSTVLNKKLYELFRAWLFFEATGTEWMRHLNVLRQYAKSELSMDLTQPRAQLEWPYLTRFFKLAEMEAKLDMEAAAKEKGALLSLFHKKNLPEQYAAALDAWKPGQKFNQGEFENLRDFVERLHDASQDSALSLSSFPSLVKTLGWSILQEEIQAAELMKETERLLDGILEALIQSSDESRLINDYKNYLLLKKLLALELTNEDYELAVKKADDIRPSKIMPGAKIAAMADEIFSQALLFYKQALEREDDLLNNALGHMQENQSPAVLVTGGFHAKGLEALLETYGISYVTIVPRITEIQKNENYLRIMTLKGDALASRSYVDLPQPADAQLPFMLPEYAAMYGEYLRIAVEEIVRKHPEARERPSLLRARSELRGFFSDDNSVSRLIRYWAGPALALLLFSGEPAASYGQYPTYPRSGYSKPAPLAPELPRMIEMSLDVANRDVLVSQLGPENGYRRVERPVTLNMRLTSLQSVRKYLEGTKYYLPQGEHKLYQGLETAAAKSRSRLLGPVSSKTIAAKVNIINARQKAEADLDLAADVQAQAAYKAIVEEYKEAVKNEIPIREELITILSGVLNEGGRFKSPFLLKSEAELLAVLVSGKDILKEYDETIRIHRLLRLDPKETFREEVKEMADNFNNKHRKLLAPIEKIIQGRLDAMLKQKQELEAAIDPEVKDSKAHEFKAAEKSLAAAGAVLERAYSNKRFVEELLDNLRKERSAAERELVKNNTAENREKVRSVEELIADRQKALRYAERSIETAVEKKAEFQKKVNQLKLETAEARGTKTELERNIPYIREALAAIQRSDRKEPEKRSELRVPLAEREDAINSVPAILDTAGISGSILPETLRGHNPLLFQELVDQLSPAAAEMEKLDEIQRGIFKEQLETKLQSLRTLDALGLLSFDGTGSAIVSAAQLSTLDEDLLMASLSVLAGMMTNGQRLIVGKDDTAAAETLKKAVLGGKNGLSETTRNRLSRGLVFPDPYLEFDELIAREVQMSKKRAEGVAAAFDAEVLRTLPPELQQLMIRMVTDLTKDFENTTSGEELARQAEALAVLFLMMMDLGAKLRDVPPDQLAVKIREYFEAKNMSRIIFNKDGSFNQPSWQDISAYLTRLRAAAESMAKSA